LADDVLVLLKSTVKQNGDQYLAHLPFLTTTLSGTAALISVTKPRKPNSRSNC